MHAELCPCIVEAASRPYWKKANENQSNDLQPIILKIKMSTKTTRDAIVAFGVLLKKWRKKVGLTSQRAALDAGMQPSNYCKIENGILKPPQNAERLRTLHGALKLDADPEISARFYDLAAKANNTTPLDLAEIISRDEAIPHMLRIIGNRRLDGHEIEAIISLIHSTNEKPVRKKNQKKI